MRLILRSDVNCVIGGVLRGVNVIFGLGLVGRFVCGVVWASAAGIDIVGWVAAHCRCVLLTVRELCVVYCDTRVRTYRYKAKRVKTRSLQDWVNHFEPKFQGEGVVPGEYFLVSIKLDTFAIWQCKLHRATCRRFDTIPACDGQTGGRTDRRTDRQTDGIAIANTALAMRALRAL